MWKFIKKLKVNLSKLINYRDMIFFCLNWVKSFRKLLLFQDSLLGEKVLLFDFLEKKKIFKILYLLKMCPIFFGSPHSNVRSDKVGCFLYIGPWNTIILGCNFPNWSKILKSCLVLTLSVESQIMSCLYWIVSQITLFVGK